MNFDKAKLKKYINNKCTPTLLTGLDDEFCSLQFIVSTEIYY